MKKIFLLASAAALFMGGCSKDFTEDVTTSAPEGKTKIVAYSTVSGVNTRTHLDKNGTKYSYAWDNGDALGVFDAVADDDTNAYFGYTGNNTFVGDYDMIAGDTYYVYYPWSRDVKLEGTTLKMYINAKQKFNHLNSSFAATEAPAVATGSAPVNGEALELEFTNLGTYVHVPIVGVGTVKTLTLGFGSKNTASSSSREYAINGSFTVDFAADDITDYYSTFNTTSSKYKFITLDCGKGVELKPTEATHFWFVVPAGLELKLNDYANFWVNYEGDMATAAPSVAPDFSYQFGRNTYTTKANTPLLLDKYYDNDGDEALEYAYSWTEGDALLISQPMDLLKYFYYATNGISNAEAKFVKDGALKEAVLVGDIDMSEVLERLYQDQFDELTPEEQAVYLWYVHISEDGANASYYTTTVGGGTTYSISAYEETGATISGWNVKGNGLFTGNGSVKGITFENVHVDATEVEDDAIYFLAKSFNEQDLTLEVNVGEGCTLAVADGATGALVGTVNASDTLPEDVALPTYAGTEDVIAYTYTFNIDQDVEMADYAEVTCNAVTLSQAGWIVTLEKKADVEPFMEKVSNATDANWYSVLAPADDEAEDAALVSYWTGLKPSGTTNLRIAAAPFTAEKLWYVNNKTGNTYRTKSAGHILTNDIDLMGKAWTTNNVTGTLKIKGEMHTISNVVINDTNKSNNYTLLGGAAYAENLTVAGITITVPAGATKVAAIACNATAAGAGAKNVTVKGLKIEAAEVTTVQAAGGLFANYNKNATITDCTVETDAINFAEGVAYGDLAGKYALTVTPDEQTAYTETFEAGKTSCGKLFGQVAVTNNTDTASTDATLNINGTFAASVVFPTKAEFTFAGGGNVYYHTFTLNVNEATVFKAFYRDGGFVE